MNKSSQDTLIKVIVADDHPIVRSGIANELARHQDIEVVGVAKNGKETLEMVRRYCPDVIILDINMPDLNGIQVLQTLSESEAPSCAPEHWPPAVLVLSAHCEPEYVYSLFAVGAKGYLLKDEMPARIVEGVRRVYRGDPALSLPVQRTLLTHRERPKHDLSSREIEVLKLIAKGYTNEEIATDLVIAEGTVKNHVTNIYRKLPNIRSRSEAVAWAWENQIVVAD